MNSNVPNASGTSSPLNLAIATPILVGINEECVKSLNDCDNYSVTEIISDLSMADLNDVHGYLGIAGAFDNISPLHHQKLLQREIFATAASRLHLVWFDHVIFIKPLPDCLINADYSENTIFTSPQAYALASGFLRSYCNLITCRTDLELAKELHLISKDAVWKDWHALRASILGRFPKDVVDSLISKNEMNMRWRYGELRLSRLNLIYRFTGRGLVYFTIHREYSIYFNQYFNGFITVFAFFSILLSALQILVAIPDKPDILDTISYGFSIASLFVVVICIGGVLFVFSAMFCYNAITFLVVHMKQRILTKSRFKASAQASA